MVNNGFNRLYGSSLTKWLQEMIRSSPQLMLIYSGADSSW